MRIVGLNLTSMLISLCAGLLLACNPLGSQSTSTPTAADIALERKTFGIDPTKITEPECGAVLFSAQTKLALATEVWSNTVSLTECVNAPTLTFSGESSVKVYVNNVAATKGSVLKTGDSLKIGFTTSTQESTTVAATVSIGRNSYTFEATTGDFTPDAIAFVAATNQNFLSFVKSAPATLAGFDGTLTASVSGEGSPVLMVNGTETGSTASVIAGNNISVKLTSAGSASTKQSATLLVGSVAATFDVTTTSQSNNTGSVQCSSVYFLPQTKLALNTAVDSNTVTLAGCTGAALISVSGTGSPALYKNGTLVSGVTSVTTGDTLRVRLTSSTAENTSATATVSIGAGSSLFSASTGSFTPAAFSFTSATGQSISTAVTSNAITLSGFDGALTATVSGSGSPQLVINGVAQGTSANVIAGNSVAVQLTSSSTSNVSLQATVSVGGVSAVFAVVTDAGVPVISTITAPTNATYGVGSTLALTANFSESVTVLGAPRLVLTIGSTTKYATYYSGSGTSQLVFRYTVDAGDADSNGIAFASTNVDLNTGTLADSSGNAAVLAFTAPNINSIFVDGVVPTVSSATGPSAITHSATQNQHLDFTINYSEIINVVGVPRIALTVGQTLRYAIYASGSGTTALLFRYTVQSNEYDSDGIEVVAPFIDLNSGTLTDEGGNTTPIGFSAPDTTGVLVDARTPTVQTVVPPSAGTHSLGQANTLDFTLVFDKSVTVLGTPRLALDVGGSTLYATYLSGSTTTSLLFRYTIQAGDVDTNGIALVSASIGLNSGSIQDALNNAATLTFTAPSLSNVLVDAVVPTITATSAPSATTYITSQNLDFTFTFSRGVYVTGTPQLALTVGSTARTANYVSGNGTTALVFRYTVPTGDEDTNGIAASTSLSLNSGTIADTVGNPAPLTFTAMDTSLVNVDGVVPTVTSATASANATYGTGQAISLSLAFSENVNVTGSPRIELTVGTATRYAIYTSGSGTSTLVFQYTVLSGDSDTNGIAVSSPLQLNSGTIADAAANAATLTFSPPTTTGVLVDGNSASVTAATGPSVGTYYNSQNLIFALTFSEAVTVTGSPRLTLTIGNTTRYATYYSGSGSTLLYFYYTVVAADGDGDGIAVASTIDLNSGTLKDAAGTNALLSFTPPATGSVLVAGSGASLDLNFTATTTLDPRMSFVHDASGSNFAGTYVGVDGLIKTAATNLYSYSNDFGNALWAKSSASIGVNTATAPDGTLTADKLIPDATLNSHYTYRSATVLSGSVYTYSVYAKEAGYNYLVINTPSGSTGGNSGPVVNLTNGTKSSDYNTPYPTTITNVGNGWYRISFRFTTNATSVRIDHNSLQTSAVTSYSGNGTSGVYLWGAQLELGSTATNYIPTTSVANGAPRFNYDPITHVNKGLLLEESRANLVSSSEEFAVGYSYGTQAVLFSSNVAVAPDGSTTADKIIENTQNAPRAWAQLVNTAAGSYTVSVFAKASERRRIMLRDGLGGGSATFDLVSGSVAGTQGTVTTSMVEMGSGWYRCALTVTATATFRTFAIFLMPDTGVSYATSSYLGDGSSGLYLWGAQIELGAFATSYIPTNYNILFDSQGLNWSRWSNNGTVSVTADDTATTDPSGLSTTQAEKLTGVSAAADGRIQAVTLVANTTYTLSAYLKPDTTTSTRFGIFDGTWVVGGDISWSAGVPTPPAGVTCTAVTGQAGWYRCTMTYTPTVSGSNYYVHIHPDRTNTQKSLWVWGVTLGVGINNGTYLSGRTRSVDIATVASVNSNLFTYSEQFDKANWSKSGGTYAPTVTLNQVLAPDGTMTADRISYPAVPNHFGIIWQNPTQAFSTLHTFSVYLRGAVGGETVWLMWTPDGATYSRTPCVLTTSWQRFSLNYTTSSSGFQYVQIGVDLRDSSQSAKPAQDIYAWGAQLEPFGSAGTYTQTTTTALNAGKQNITPWYNATESTLAVEFGPYPGAPASKNFFLGGFYDDTGTSNNAMDLFSGSGVVPVLRVMSGGSSTVYLNGGTFTAGITNKIAGAFKASDFSRSANGAAALVSALGVIPFTTHLKIGHSSGNGGLVNGTVSRVRYWPVRLTDSELAGLSQP